MRINSKLTIILALLLGACSSTVTNTTSNTSSLPEDVLAIPEGFPSYTTEGRLTNQGRYLTAVNFDGHHFLVDFNRDGDILWYDEATNGNNKTDKYRSCYRHAETPGVYYFFERTEGRNNRYVGAKLVIFDDHGKSSQYFYQLKGNENPIDPHDAVVFDVNHYIIETSISGDETGGKQHSYIQEVKDGKILWEFASEKYSDLVESRYLEGDNRVSVEDSGDYMHFNSFAIDPVDGHLLVSYRNQSSIFKINRKNGEIIWKLGGYDSDFAFLDPKAEFHYQHSVQAVDGNILVFDNGFMNDDARILELKINETDKTVELVRELPLGYPVSNYGEVIKTSNNTYIVQRGQSPVLDRACGFDEIDCNTGEILFSINFEDKTQSFWIDYSPQ